MVWQQRIIKTLLYWFFVAKTGLFPNLTVLVKGIPFELLLTFPLLIHYFFVEMILQPSPAAPFTNMTNFNPSMAV